MIVCQSCVFCYHLWQVKGGLLEVAYIITISGSVNVTTHGLVVTRNGRVSIVCILLSPLKGKGGFIRSCIYITISDRVNVRTRSYTWAIVRNNEWSSWNTGPFNEQVTGQFGIVAILWLSYKIVILFLTIIINKQANSIKHQRTQLVHRRKRSKDVHH